MAESTSAEDFPKGADYRYTRSHSAGSHFLKDTALLPNNNTLLAFPLTLRPGFSPQTIATLGEAAKFLTELTEEQRERGYWKIAIGSLGAAVREPSYIKTATLSLQAALTLERMLADPPDPA